jgi:hypothetical protein
MHFWFMKTFVHTQSVVVARTPAYVMCRTLWSIKRIDDLRESVLRDFERFAERDAGKLVIFKRPADLSFFRPLRFRVGSLDVIV